MELENIKLSSLKTYGKNPRNNENAVAYVVNSIKKYGFLVPIIIDKDNVIVCGHTRYKACKQLGMKEVPCIRAEQLTDEQIKAFRIEDNKTNEKAMWDIDLLRDELGDLKELGVDLEDLGFMDFELDNIFGGTADIEDFFEDKIESKEKKPKTIICPECGHEFTP